MECYTIIRSRIVYEILNTEVIAIDFNTGNYYALAHVAKQIWQMLEQKTPFDQMAQMISNSYALEPSKVTADLRHFINELLENGLIEPSSEIGEPVQIAPLEGPYEPPRIHVYTDVQNLLLLDPVHEVTEAGWPEKINEKQSVL